MGERRDRVLLLDRDARARDVVREALCAVPRLDVREVLDEASLSQALETGEFDLVLTEHHTGWSFGLDVLRRAKSVRAEAPVFLLVEEADVSFAVEAMRAGFDDCIAKRDGGLARVAEAVVSALKRSRDHLHATRRTSSLEVVLQRLKVGFFRLTSTGQLLRANRECLDLLGVGTLAQAHQLNLHERILHGEVARQIEADLRRTGRVPLTEVVVRRADGGLARLCLSESLGTTVVGDAVVDGILLEPSPYRMEHVPMATAARVHVTLHSLPLVLFLLDRYGHVVWIQGRDLAQLGIDPSKSVGTMISSLCPSALNVMDDVRRALNGEEVTTTLRFGDRQCRVRLSPLRGSRSVAPEVAGVAVEVRDDAATVAGRTGERPGCRVPAEKLIHASPVAMCVLDDDGTVRAWNGAATTLFGLTEGDVIGKPFPFLTPEEMWRSLSTLRDDEFAGTPVYAWKEQRRRIDGSLVEMDLFAAPLLPEEEEPAGILVVAIPPASFLAAISEPWKGIARKGTGQARRMPALAPLPLPVETLELSTVLPIEPALAPDVEAEDFERHRDFGPVSLNAEPPASAEPPEVA